jgi:hypothetical protein
MSGGSDLGYLANTEKCKQITFVANQVLPISGVGMFYLG